MRSFTYVQVSVYGAVCCFAFEVSIESGNCFFIFFFLIIVLLYCFILSYLLSLFPFKKTATGKKWRQSGIIIQVNGREKEGEEEEKDNP